jgi:hypothetical protein
MKRFDTVKFTEKQRDVAENIKQKAIDLEKSINAVRKNGGVSVVHNYLESALLHLETCVMMTNKAISRNDNFL